MINPSKSTDKHAYIPYTVVDRTCEAGAGGTRSTGHSTAYPACAQQPKHVDFARILRIISLASGVIESYNTNRDLGRCFKRAFPTEGTVRAPPLGGTA